MDGFNCVNCGTWTACEGKPEREVCAHCVELENAETQSLPSQQPEGSQAISTSPETAGAKQGGSVTLQPSTAPPATGTHDTRMLPPTTSTTQPAPPVARSTEPVDTQALPRPQPNDNPTHTSDPSSTLSRVNISPPNFPSTQPAVSPAWVPAQRDQQPAHQPSTSAWPPYPAYPPWPPAPYAWPPSTPAAPWPPTPGQPPAAPWPPTPDRPPAAPWPPYYPYYYGPWMPPQIPTHLPATPLPEFWGQTHEDPSDFLEKLTAAFRSQGTPPSMWLHIGKWQLKGEAEAWWGEYGEFVTEWEQLATRLKHRFAGRTSLASAGRELYGTEQSPGQPVERFIRQKARLHQRLYPTAGIDELLDLLIDQVVPPLRPLLRTTRPHDLEELIRLAVDLESVLGTQRENKAPNRAPPPPARQGPNRAPPLSAPPERQSAPYSTPNQLPQCRHCPKRHFHRDCPVLREKNANRNNQSGNHPVA